MQITDPIADMLTRIRNANSAKHETVDVPVSNMNGHPLRLINNGNISVLVNNIDGNIFRFYRIFHRIGNGNDYLASRLDRFPCLGNNSTLNAHLPRPVCYFPFP